MIVPTMKSLLRCPTGQKALLARKQNMPCLP
uniref:Uncharacterized protein n=1 Tax=Arundo donax TaxID=35708 RepID=A0A0A9BP57_ARUDO